MSRFTLTLKRYPTATLIVGWTFRFRLVICAPKIGGLLADCAPGDLRRTRVGKERPILVLRNLRGRGEEARQDREADQSSVVAVHFIAEPGEAVSVLADHAGEIERRAVRVDDAVPDHLYAVLAVADARVVDADQARALRDQEIAPRGGVVDIRGDKRFEFSRQVRIERLLQHGGDLPASLDLVA